LEFNVGKYQPGQLHKSRSYCIPVQLF